MFFLNPWRVRIDAVKVPSMFFEVLFKLASAHCDGLTFRSGARQTCESAVVRRGLNVSA